MEKEHCISKEKGLHYALIILYIDRTKKNIFKNSNANALLKITLVIKDSQKYIKTTFSIVNKIFKTFRALII